MELAAAAKKGVNCPGQAGVRDAAAAGCESERRSHGMLLSDPTSVEAVAVAKKVW